ncbi:MAG: sulfite exporter TauE/SafE family protein [Clostridia bacterium]|nr:sulfite exporter TauE/SafE family protein [Clostridia bacterium]
MSFIVYMLTGFAAGVIGGMGMGGGTILIPALTILLGVNQHLAQATNVIAFLPMAALALPAHKKNGLLRTDDVWEIIIPALITTVLGGLLMAALPTEVLKKLFGFFLVALAVKQSFSLVTQLQNKSAH